MRRTFRPVAVLVLLLAIFYLEARALGRIPAYVQDCEKSQHTGYEECSTYHISFYALRQIGKFLDTVSPAVTAAATGVIAAFTWTIWLINRSQLEHGRQVERAYVSGGGGRKLSPTELPGKDGEPMQVLLDTGVFEFHVSNYGKTPGKVFQIGYGFCEMANVPDVDPTYTLEYIDSWIDPGRSGLPIFVTEIPRNLAHPAAYGRVYYETIFGDRFSSGFLYRIPRGQGGGVSIRPPNPRYTNDREE
jgi:hypothetical protein